MSLELSFRRCLGCDARQTRRFRKPAGLNVRVSLRSADTGARYEGLSSPCYVRKSRSMITSRRRPPANEAQRFSGRAGNSAVLYHRITQRLQRSAHCTADLGAGIEARLCPIASRWASTIHLCPLWGGPLRVIGVARRSTLQRTRRTSAAMRKHPWHTDQPVS